MTAQLDPQTLRVAIVCAAISVVTLVLTLGAVAVMAGNVGVGAIGAALGAILTAATRAYRQRRNGTGSP